MAQVPFAGRNRLIDYRVEVSPQLLHQDWALQIGNLYQLPMGG